MQEHSLSSVEELVVQLRNRLERRHEESYILTCIQHLRRLSSQSGETEWDKSDLVRYLDKMAKDGQSSDSISRAYFILKTVTISLGNEWVLSEDDLPRVRPRPVHRPVIGVEALSNLIEGVKASGDALERLLLAGSSVYGMRRIELSRLGADNKVKSFGQVKNAGQDYFAMWVDTAKHGVPREHLIPPELWQWMKPGVQELPVPVTTLTYIWNRMCRNYGYERQDREGWHSVRRILVGELVRAGFAETEILEFMRWSPGRSMVARYAAPQRSIETDERIFTRHPFLEVWKR